MGSDPDPTICSLLDSDDFSNQKKLESSSESGTGDHGDYHQFLRYPMNPHLPLEALADDDDSQSHSSDSSDVDATDSEDEDVISVPLRGRTISYLRTAFCDQPCCLHKISKGNGKCKTIDAFSMDFKLKVLEWAYTKTIHSAGHHFNLERCVVRNWMMNEEKIVMLASSKGRRKWARYDQVQKKHKETAKYSRSKPLDARVLKALGSLRVSGNRS